MSWHMISNGGTADHMSAYLVVCTVLQRDPHYYRKTEADLAALELIDLHPLAFAPIAGLRHRT
jgi:hypothetical protein